MRGHRFRLVPPSLIALLTAATIGCSSKSSSTGADDGGPIATSEMHIDATVEAADESTAAVSVRLHDDGGLFRTEYRLTGGDRLTACVVARCQQLEHDADVPFTGNDYDGELPHFSLIPYAISFSRSVGANAPSSVVTLPLPFAILSPAAGVRVTDGETVTVQWSPEGAGEEVYIDAAVDCEHENGVHTDWSGPRLARNVLGGSAVVSVDTMLQSLSAFAATASPVTRCDLKLKVSHEHGGKIDAAFAGGSIVGRVLRRVTIDYRPSPPQPAVARASARADRA